MDKNSSVKIMDSLYAHLDSRNVVLNQIVKRGQRIGAIGNNRGMYLAHLHFETRKNLSIGMHRSSFAKTYSNYYSPTSFIRSYRNCEQNKRLYKVPINTFAPYPGTYPKNKNTPCQEALHGYSFSHWQPYNYNTTRQTIIQLICTFSLAHSAHTAHRNGI